MRRTRRGNVITTVLVTPVLLGIGSLGVDLSQAYVARAQLQNVMDLSARSGATLLDGTAAGLVDAVDAALEVVAANEVLGQEVQITRDDVLTGYWSVDQGAFVPTSDPALVDALEVAASADVEMYFADLFLGVETIPVSTSAAAFNAGGGAGSVDCFIPLALPDCVVDNTSKETLRDMEFKLSPAGIDNVGWASPADLGNASAEFVRSHLFDCEAAGTVTVGDQLWLNNGQETVAMGALEDLISTSTDTWDPEVYSELPAQMDGSSIKHYDYGKVFEGPILVFDAPEAYCSGDGGWNEKDAVVTGMIWAAVYDVDAHGLGKNIRVRLDLEREHQVGKDLGGSDYGVQSALPLLVH